MLAVAGDPGGANALTPVLHQLHCEQKVTLLTKPYREAIDSWQHLPCASAPIRNRQSATQTSTDIFTHDVALVLTGTSVNGLDYEKAYIGSARQAGIPSLAVLDYWSNYAKRFANHGTEQLTYLPDRIAVMDEIARQGMLAEGIPDHIINITGQPALDGLDKIHQAFSPRKKAAVRRHLGVGEDETLILFASQPIAECCGHTASDAGYIGYTEKTVVQDLVASLDSMASTEGKMTLVVRPHPREKSDLFTPKTTEKGVRLLIDRHTDKQNLMLSVDIVTGMDSMLLVEACYLHCPTLSLQPGLLSGDALPSNRAGLCTTVYENTHIQPALKKLLATNSHTPLSVRPQDATQNIISHLYELLKSTSA